MGVVTQLMPEVTGLVFGQDISVVRGGDALAKAD